MTVSYEDLLALARELRPAPHGMDRRVTWCPGSNSLLGLARTFQGRIELFLVGEHIQPHWPIIAGNIQYSTWYRANGDAFTANRLLLPAAVHFDQIAAFLCVELIRNGIDVDMLQAYRRTEPVIAMAIQQLWASEDSILGLTGELIVMDALLAAASPDQTSAVLSSWVGYAPSSRDFQLGNVGVEVKATRGVTSRHPVQGVTQVESGHGVDQAPETRLFLVSVGLGDADGTEAASSLTSLSSLIASITERIEQNAGAAATQALAVLEVHIDRYGAAGQVSPSDHASISENPSFTRDRRRTFLRCYDLDDPAIRLLTSEILGHAEHVVGDTVTFTIDLPSQISGDVNPVAGTYNSARAILVAAGIPTR